jgi:hypothetical protein
VSLGQVSHRVLRFALSVSFHQWSTFIFIRITNGRSLEAFQKALLLRKSDSKVLSLIFFFLATITKLPSPRPPPGRKRLQLKRPSHSELKPHKTIQIPPPPIPNKKVLPLAAQVRKCDHVKAISHDVKPGSVRTTPVTVTKFPYQNPAIFGTQVRTATRNKGRPHARSASWRLLALGCLVGLF